MPSREARKPSEATDQVLSDEVAPSGVRRVSGVRRMAPRVGDTRRPPSQTFRAVTLFTAVPVPKTVLPK